MVDGHHHASGKRDYAWLVTAADAVIDGALWLTASADAGKTIHYGIIDLAPYGTHQPHEQERHRII